MQVGTKGECDGTAASWSAGQPLNSKSTHLIVTCQGYEREEEGEGEESQGERWHNKQKKCSSFGTRLSDPFRELASVCVCYLHFMHSLTPITPYG